MSSESAQTVGNRIMTPQNAEYLLSNTNDKESLEENTESLNGTSDFLQDVRNRQECFLKLWRL